MSETVDITKTHVPILYVVIIVGAIVGGALAVARTYDATASKVDRLSEKVADLPSKADIKDIKTETAAAIEVYAKERILFYLNHGALKCNPAPGTRRLSCKFEFPIAEEHER